MAIGDTFSLVKTSSFPNGTTARLFHFLLPAGVIDSARIKIEGANTSDDVVFNLAIDGVAVTTTELTMASGTNEIEATGLAETVTNDQWATVSIDAPFVSGSLDGITAIGVHVTYVTQTVNLTGAQTVAGVKTFSSDPIIPDEAYDATNWNGVLEPPTKNAVRDKIEDILDGVTFTGDVVVPDEAYGVGWNGSLEVPTKNAVYDKIETVGSGSVATDAIWDALGDLAVGTGANTAAKLTVGTDGHFLSANSAEPTGLEWVALAGGGDLLSTNNLSDVANAGTARTNLGVAIGSDVQAYDADLTTWAGITPGTNVGTQLALNANGSDVDAIGFRGIPQNSQSVDYTLVLADSGKHIYQTGASKTVTIPANASVAFEIGTTVTFVATDAGGCTIAITTDVLRWAEDGSTGSVALAQYGIATALKVTATEWIISGVGIS